MFGQTNPENNVTEIKQEIKKNVDTLAEDIRDRATKMAGMSKDRASEYYDDAGDWLRGNYGKALIGVGVLAAAGAAAYFIVRNHKGKLDLDL